MGERNLLRLEIVHITIDKVKAIGKGTDRHVNYADNYRRNLEFDGANHAFLWASHWKGIVRLGKKGKLSPHYVGPFEIITKVGSTTY